MGIYLRCLDIRVAEEFLNDADRDPVFQHVRGKTVTQRVTSHSFGSSG